MEVTSEKLGEDVVLIKINGRFVGIEDSLKLREELKKQIGEKEPKIIVDLGNVSIMDPTALVGLVGIYNSVSEEGGKIVLLKPNEWVKNLITIVKMDIYESLELAQSSFES